MEKWNEVKAEMESKMLSAGYNTWIKPLKLQSVNEKTKTVSIITDNDLTKSILLNRYQGILSDSVKKIYGWPEAVINIILSEDIKGFEEASTEKDDIRIPGNDELYLNPRYNFSTFVVGKNNELAYAAAQAVARDPGSVYNPLFIFGNSGLGKTHLMHAIGHHILQENAGKKVLYVSSEMFTNELVNAIQSKKNEEFRAKYRNIDVLMIDDIQFIEKKDRTQEELFHTFDTLYGLNKQIIFTSDRPPKEIETIDNRLKTRFEWGLTVDIQSPDFETRLAILKNKAEMEDLEVTEDMFEIFSLIADKITTNIRELEGALNRVIAHANLMNKPLTKETAKEVLTDIFDTSNRNIDIPLIKNVVCTYFGINVQDIESSKRTKTLAYPRQIAMYLCRELTDMSLPKIGDYFGNRDHTTVMHACEKISKDIRTDKELSKKIDEIKKEILDN